MNNELNYTVKDSELKAMGYKFQKLYANNYKSYRKEISGHTIWLWSKGKTIEIDNWHQNTKAIIEFYKANKNSPLFDEVGYKGQVKDYIKVQMNPDNGFIQLFDFKEYFKVFSKKNVETAWDDWNKKYEGWQNEILIFRDKFELILKEIELLTK